MKGICSVADDYLGVPIEDCVVSFDNPISAACWENWYCQKQPDNAHPFELLKVCGNCLYWIVIESKEDKS